MDGLKDIPPTPATGSGVPPEAEMRHKVLEPPRWEENTISLPSSVQTGDVLELSKVSRLGSPPVAGITNKSLPRPPTLPRAKATLKPSGEKEGSSSTSSGMGDVSGRVVKSASESKAIRERMSFALRSENAKTLPSGDQSQRTA